MLIIMPCFFFQLFSNQEPFRNQIEKYRLSGTGGKGFGKAQTEKQKEGLSA